jgi:hypothetical protein
MIAISDTSGSGRLVFTTSQHVKRDEFGHFGLIGHAKTQKYYKNASPHHEWT